MAAIVLLTNMTSAALAQNTASQTIRGHVADVASSEPMIGVMVVIDDMDGKGTVTDMDGNFIIEHVPVGRHSIRASYVGYEPLLLKEQLLSSGKEMVLNLRMRENLTELGEVVVKPAVGC